MDTHKLARAGIAIASSIFVLGAVACSDDGGGSGGSEGGSGSVEGPLAEAAQAVPADATDAFFTDWDGLAEGLGTERSEDFIESKPLLDAMRETGVTPAVFYDQYLVAEDHAEQVGWTFGDVDWELTYTRAEGPSTLLMRFNEGFDNESLVSLFEERGYDSEEQDGVTIYHHEMDPSAEWQVGEFGPAVPREILNVALLDDGLVAMSSEQAEVEAAAETFTGADSPALDAAMATASEYADSPVSMFFSGEQERCEAWIESASATPEVLEVLGEFRGNPYVSLGIGYSLEGEEPSAEATLRYEDASQAEEDVTVRENAATASSPRTRQPYSESVFQLDEASAEDTDLKLEFSPVNGVLNFSDEVRAGTLLFAAC